MKTPSCILCRVLLSSEDVPFRRLFTVGDLADEVLFETTNYVVVADVAPVVEGHCLIVSRRHVRSMAEMGVNALGELGRLVLLVQERLFRAYGPSCAFEHGSGKARLDAACIEHAHLHVAPCAVDLRARSKYKPTFFHIPDWESLASIEPGLGYLFTRTADGACWLSLRTDLERQHWRGVLAELCGGPYGDWRSMTVTRHGRDIARERIRALHAIFSMLPQELA